MKTLRGPQGCPWDKAQTPPDLNAHLIEEAYEVVEAVDSRDPLWLQEELGDLLLQIVFHAQMASEANQFHMGDVIQSISDKLVRRHPHVFGDVTVNGVQDVKTNWEKIKAEEKKAKGGDKSLLSNVPPSLPALLKAYRLGDKASHVGFDWPNAEGILAKIKEEVAELEAEVKANDKEKMSDEFGDLLFSLANMARSLKINPEDALRRTCDKFTRRFRLIEEKVASSRKKWEEFTLEELDAFWSEAKDLENKAEAKKTDLKK